mmetsp:Transcript_10184/g.30727  ORF Transcript_10184/g.30727 Transcript_10184/m.30727 type:complete len:230 (-) Transcript_10184:32-721(-)
MNTKGVMQRAMPNLKNNYWLVRHGRSLANEAGIIIAKKENGVKPEYGLADLGKKQALEAGALLKERLASSPSGLSKLVVYSSPFSRTIQTAQGVLEGAGIPETPIQMKDELMERGFGTVLETKSALDGYNKTWEQDAKDTAYKAGSLEGSDDGESVDDVSARVRSMFKGFEEAHEDMNILLVSHGDTLSIMQATMEEGDRKQHTRYQFSNCELRLLGSGPGEAKGPGFI